jgi:tRNA isopentenyl-2-thiomethyl-A-37 hydroxylase MiaE
MNVILDVPVDDFHKKEYIFWFYDNRDVLYLDKYYECERKTKRHAWKIVKKYDRIDNRYNEIKASEVPLTEELKEQAKKILIDSIQVKLWDRE